MNGFFRVYSFKEIELIRACGVSSPGEVVESKEIMLQAEQLAEKWFERG